MMHDTLNILIVDDDEGDRKQIIRSLKGWETPCTCTEASGIDDALRACAICDFDCAVVDYQMPGQDGLRGIDLLHKRLPEMSIIMATGHGDERIAIEAMKMGASDYIPKKQMDDDFIRHIIEGALEKDFLRHKVTQQRVELENFARLLAHDLKQPIQAIYGIADFMEMSIREKRWERISEHCRNLLEFHTAFGRIDKYTGRIHQDRCAGSVQTCRYELCSGRHDW